MQNKLAKLTRPRKAMTFPVCSVYTSRPVPDPPVDFATVSVMASRYVENPPARSRPAAE